MARTKVTPRRGVNQRHVLSLEEEGRQAATRAGLTRPWDHRPIRERTRSPPPLPVALPDCIPESLLPHQLLVLLALWPPWKA